MADNNGYIYLLGSTAGEYKTTQRYNTNSGLMDLGTNLQIGRYGAACSYSSLQDKLFIFGGFEYGGAGQCRSIESKAANAWENNVKPWTIENVNLIEKKYYSHAATLTIPEIGGEITLIVGGEFVSNPVGVGRQSHVLRTEPQRTHRIYP